MHMCMKLTGKTFTPNTEKLNCRPRKRREKKLFFLPFRRLTANELIAGNNHGELTTEWLSVSSRRDFYTQRKDQKLENRGKPSYYEKRYSENDFSRVTKGKALSGHAPCVAFIANFSTWIFPLSLAERGSLWREQLFVRIFFLFTIKILVFAFNIHKNSFSFSRKLAPLVDFHVTQINDLARVKCATLAARIKAHKLIRLLSLSVSQIILSAREFSAKLAIYNRR